MAATNQPRPRSRLDNLPPFPTDSTVALQLITTAHQESQAAFYQLLQAPSDNNALSRQLHQHYRDKTAYLLEILRQHNHSPMALPLPWDLTLIAQPLVQQTLIEADIIDALGEPAEAIPLRDWAVAIAQQDLPPLAFARIRRSMAVQRAAEGRFNEALTEFDDVRRLFTEFGDVLQSAQTTLEQASLLEWLGDHERALSSLTKARRLLAAEEGGALPTWEETSEAVAREIQSVAAGSPETGEADRGSAHWRASVELVEHEARVRKSLGENDAAAELFQSVLPQYQSIGGGPAIEYQLAAIDRARGRFAAAQERLHRIEPAFADGLLSGRVAGLRLLQADVSLGLKQPATALQRAEEGLAETDAHPDDDLAWRLHGRRAQSLRALGRTPDALAAFSTALDFVDSLRKSPLGYRLDNTALHAKLPLIQEAIAFAADCGAASTCLRFIELIKARALSSSLSVRAADRVQRTDRELEFDHVTQQLDALEYRAYSGAADGADVRRAREILLARRIELIEQIRLRDPRWRGLTAPPPFDPIALAASLKNRQQSALTLYLEGNIVRSVLVIDGHFHLGRQTIHPDTLELLNAYTASLILPTPDPFALDPADLQLDAALFVPSELLEQALSASSLLIAPHGQLHLLPWPSLPFGEKRLFERAPVGIIPNLTCALVLHYPPATHPRLALAGAASYPGLPQILNLPSTARELSDVAALYASRLVAKPLPNKSATEAAVRALATRGDAASAILHLSCHGTLSVADPLGSGILLADGKIDAAEWAQLRIHYDEVVLSACSTGWRPQTAPGVTLHGDDVLGLPGALLEAGARSVIVSIPKAVDAATTLFMTAYHTHRSAGTPPLIAFCRTQREMLSSGHPAYTWSGLVCYGVC